MKLKEIIDAWPLHDWKRGTLIWDNHPGLLKLESVNEPGTAGTFDLTAADAQLCRWNTTLVIDDPKLHAPVATALAAAVGKTLTEAGDIDV